MIGLIGPKSAKLTLNPMRLINTINKMLMCDLLGPYVLPEGRFSMDLICSSAYCECSIRLRSGKFGGTFQYLELFVMFPE